MKLFSNGNDDKSIARIVNSILRFAYRDGASEITIEPQTGEVAVFHTIKGEQRRGFDLPLSVFEPVVLHIKELANITESQIEGLIQVRMQDKQHDFCLHYNLRVKINPTPLGHRITLSFEDENTFY